MNEINLTKYPKHLVLAVAQAAVCNRQKPFLEDKILFVRDKKYVPLAELMAYQLHTALLWQSS